MGKIYKIEDHSIEFREGSSSLDPWSLQYCREIGLSLMSTSDMVSYVRLDEEQIYRLNNFYKTRELVHELERNSIETWEELEFFYCDLFEDFVGIFSQEKKNLDEVKKRNDEFLKLSPSEKKKMVL